MRSSGISHSPLPGSFGRDPVRAAEEDIRRYLIRRGVVAPSEPRLRHGLPSLCLLSIYAAIALIIFLGSLWLARMECDPLFTDRGLTSACRNRAGALAKIMGPAGNAYSGFMPSGMSQ